MSYRPFRKTLGVSLISAVAAFGLTACGDNDDKKPAAIESSSSYDSEPSQIDNAKEKADEVVEEVKEKAAEIKEDAEQIIEETQDKMEEVKGKTNDMMKDKLPQ